VEGGPPYLLLSGAAGGRVSTPDNAALDITGDLFLLVEMQASIPIPAAGLRHELLAKWDSAAQRAYHFGWDEYGRLVLFWSTTGANALSALSQYTIPFRTAGPVTVAVFLDVNFLGNHFAVFWGIEGTRDDLLAALVADETAVRLGAPFVGSGTTSIFNSSAPLEIGDIAGAGDITPAVGVRRAQVRSGNWTGTVVANPDFTAQAVGATGFTDSAGRVWAVQGDAKITNRQHRFVGATGSVDLRWPQPRQRDADLPEVARASLTLAGPLRQMQQGAKPLRSALYRVVTSPSVRPSVLGYWPCEDGPDASRLAGAGIFPINPMRINGAVEPGADSSLAASLPLPTNAGGELGSWDARIKLTTNSTWVFEEFVRIPTITGTEVNILTVDTAFGTADRWRILIDSGEARLQAVDSTGSFLENQAAAIGSELFEHWFLLRFEASQNGGNVDWEITLVPIPELGFSIGGGGFSGSFAGTLGRAAVVGRTVDTAPPDGMSFGHIIYSNGDLPLGWLAGADTAWAEETAAHRVWRLCREEGIPIAIVGDNTVAANFRGDPLFSHPMGAQLPKPLLDLLQECADADLGILYEQRTTPGLAYRTHRSLQNQATRLTLDLPLRGLADPFEPTLDDQRLRNDITVKRTDGSSAQVADQSSIDAEGRYDEEITVNVATDEQADNQAGWRLHLGTWPELRLPAVATSLRAAGPAVVADWLAVDLGDRFEATNLMRQVDPATDQLLEGYEETLSFFHWKAALNGSPAGPWEVGVRNDFARGKRDTAGSELVTGIDDNDTSLSVATTLGPVWSAVDADDGFDIAIGGERMTVTDISGAASPQTFTVTRSVNGVVKAHLAGADVRLWRPTVRSL